MDPKEMKVTEEMTGPELVKEYNRLAVKLEMATVKRFGSKPKGIERVDDLRKRFLDMSLAKSLDEAEVGMGEKEAIRQLTAAGVTVAGILKNGGTAFVSIAWKGDHPTEYAIGNTKILKAAKEGWAKFVSEGRVPVNIEVGTYEQTPIEKKGNDPVAKPKPKQKPKGTAKKSTPKPKYTRSNALAEVLEGKETLDKGKIILQSNTLYIKHGGKDNIKEATWAFNTGMALLVALDLVVIGDLGSITLK